MTRRIAVAAVSLALVGGAATAPQAMAGKKPLPKPIKGTWSYTDQTIDPSPSVTSNADQIQYVAPCESPVPGGGPNDVTTHKITIKGKGILEVNATHTGDWALELKNSKGEVLDYSDGGLPNDQEALYYTLTKAGSYTVVACNLGGTFDLSAAYVFTYKR